MRYLGGLFIAIGMMIAIALLDKMLAGAYADVSPLLFPTLAVLSLLAWIAIELADIRRHLEDKAKGSA